MSINNQNKKWFGVVVPIVVCLVLVSVAQADWQEKAKLLAGDGASGDYFGVSVFISDDLAIVGAAGDDDRGDYSGSAYIFRWDGTGWIEQQKLTASDGASGDYFGISVSISGDYAVVGASGDDDKGADSGSAYIFKWNGTSWVQQQKLTASDGNASDYFGYSVSISGDYAIVGAPYKLSYSGSAYIFNRNGETWSQQQKLLASDGTAGDEFGYSVSISGDKSIVGAYLDDDMGTNSGSAYVFNRNGETWSQQQKLLASDGTTWDEFGFSVSISGDYATIGAGGDDDKGADSGSAYIFKWNGTGWVQQQKLTTSYGAESDGFGISVSIRGDYAIVGAGGDDDKGADSGSAYIFRRDGTNWVEQQKLTASDGASDNYFGYSVSISGDLAIIGTWDVYEIGPGSAYIFQGCADWLTADLNGDCFVDFADFGIFASQWLKCGNPSDPNCQP